MVAESYTSAARPRGPEHANPRHILPPNKFPHPTREKVAGMLERHAHQVRNQMVAHGPLTETEKGQLRLLIRELSEELERG